MDQTKAVGLKAILIVVIAFALYIVIVMFSWGYNFQAHTYQKGQAVTIVSNITEIVGDQVCQKVDYANISYTGEKDKNWFRLTRGNLGFPSTQYYVIKADNTQLWISEDNIEKFDANKVWCSPLPKK